MRGAVRGRACRRSRCTSVEPTAISSQNTNRVIRSPAKRDADRRAGIDERGRRARRGCAGRSANSAAAERPSARRWWRTGATAGRPAAAPGVVEEVRRCQAAPSGTCQTSSQRDQRQRQHRAALRAAPRSQRQQQRADDQHAGRAGCATRSQSSSVTRRSRCPGRFSSKPSALATTIIATQATKPNQALKPNSASIAEARVQCGRTSSASTVSASTTRKPRHSSA